MSAIDDPALFAQAINERWERDIIPELARYIALPCLSPAFDAQWKETGALDEAAALLLAWCRDRAIGPAHFEIVEHEGRTPLLFGEIAASDDARRDETTLIYGHFDKQPPLGRWHDGLDAFRPVREGDRLYGRGSADDGYATFAATAALEALHREGLGHGRIVVLIEGSEESGSTDLDSYVELLAPRIGEPELVLCLDSGCATYDRLWVTTSLRGVIVGELRVEVLREGVHSGHAGGIVPSSFRICRELLSRIEDEVSGEIRLAELHGTLPTHREREIEQVAEEFGEDVAGIFPTVDGVRMIGTSATERVVNGTWRPSLEVTGVEGIPALGDAGNVLRPYTTLKLSIRVPPSCDVASCVRAIERALTADPPDGARVSFTCDQDASGWDAPKLATWLERALDDASVAYFGAPWRALGIGGSIPFMAALGARFPHAQFLATGVLGPESNAHGPNEFLHVPTAKALTATMAHILAITHEQ